MGRSKSFNELFKEYRDEKLIDNNHKEIGPDSSPCSSKYALNNKLSHSLTFPIDAFPMPQCDFLDETRDTTTVLTHNSHAEYSNQPQQNNECEAVDNRNVQFRLGNRPASMSSSRPQDYSKSNSGEAASTQSNQVHSKCSISNNFLVNINNTNVNNTATSQSFVKSKPLNMDEISKHLNINYLNKMLVKHHPRPSAVTSFNARLTDNGGGYTLWDRRQDNLRLILSNTFAQTESFLNKNRSFTSGSVAETPQAPDLDDLNERANASLQLPADSNNFSYHNNNIHNNNSNKRPIGDTDTFKKGILCLNN